MDEDILDAMSAAGMSVILTESNREEVSKALIVKNSQIKSKQDRLEQFWEGAEAVGLRSLLRRFPEVVEPLLCFTCGGASKLTTDAVVEVLSFDQHGQQGSNERQQSEEVAQNLEQFLYDCEDSKCGEISVCHVLRFMTGCSSIPSCGLFKKIDIDFASAERYTVASTCTFDVTLPLNLTSYQRLKAVLKESLISGQAFGVV